MCSAAYATISIGCPVLSFSVGSFGLFYCFAKEATNDIRLLEIDGQKSMKYRRTKLIKRFHYIIQFYSDAKQLS